MDKKQKEQIIKDVFEILGKTFEALEYAYKHNQEPDGKSGDDSMSKLVFPKYENNKKQVRVSEQELRFEFIRQLLVKNDYYYSIETPTKERYIFSKDSKAAKGCGVEELVPVVVCKEGKMKKHYTTEDYGQSAMFDTVLYRKDAKGNLSRVCLIEFKAHNADSKEYKKDILKLKCEGKDEIPCFFVNLIEKEDDRNNILKKVFNEKDEEVSLVNGDTIYFILHLIGQNKDFHFSNGQISNELNETRTDI